MPSARLAKITANSPTALEVFDAKARLLVKDLHQVKPGIYWTDLIATSVAGWLCFGLAVASPLGSARFVLSVIAACFLLYRALCFIHELSHIRRAALPAFEFVWNLIAGVPLLMPSFVYIGVHQDHHSLSTYGTERDPEYLPFAGSRIAVAAFLAQSLVVPFLLLCRFLLLPWPALFSARYRLWLARYVSSLSMNVRYVRNVSDDLLARMSLWQIYIVGFWAVAAIVAIQFSLGWRMLLVWYAVTGLASFINTLRTLAAHHYESSGEPRTRIEQVTDSIDTPGGPWTELWAPTGLRYHAVHHYFPGIPYHNLGKAYRRLVAAESAYCSVSSPGIATSLAKLIRSSN